MCRKTSQKSAGVRETDWLDSRRHTNRRPGCADRSTGAARFQAEKKPSQRRMNLMCNLSSSAPLLPRPRSSRLLAMDLIPASRPVERVGLWWCSSLLPLPSVCPSVCCPALPCPGMSPVVRLTGDWQVACRLHADWKRERKVHSQPGLCRGKVVMLWRDTETSLGQRSRGGKVNRYPCTLVPGPCC
ncbi:hypothetical protein LZ32DRAFT_278108 [Colletotrichum eremochloae]|nr:hypothetical protein LZ32DRAFT_278108 [Colletotrichum eremochloae]